MRFANLANVLASLSRNNLVIECLLGTMKNQRREEIQLVLSWLVSFFTDYTTVSNVSTSLLCSAVLVSAIRKNDLICYAELVDNVRVDTNAALKDVQTSRF